MLFYFRDLEGGEFVMDSHSDLRAVNPPGFDNWARVTADPRFSRSDGFVTKSLEGRTVYPVKTYGFSPKRMEAFAPEGNEWNVEYTLIGRDRVGLPREEVLSLMQERDVEGLKGFVESRSLGDLVDSLENDGQVMALIRQLRSGGEEGLADEAYRHLEACVYGNHVRVPNPSVYMDVVEVGIDHPMNGEAYRLLKDMELKF